MIYVFKVILITIILFAYTITEAETKPIPLYDIQPQAQILPHREIKIFLNNLNAGAVYTVTCDLSNNYFSQYPLIPIMLGSNIHGDIFYFINTIEGPKANLTMNINKLTVKHVIRGSQNGYYLFVDNYHDFSHLTIYNCYAQLSTEL